MLAGAIVYSAILIGIFSLGYRRPPRGLRWAGIIAFGFVALTCAPYVIWGQFLLASIAAAVCISTRVRFGHFLACQVSLAVAVYATAALVELREYREKEAVRAKYPPVSLTERLAYESKGRSADLAGSSPSAVDGKHDGVIAAADDLAERHMSRLESRFDQQRSYEAYARRRASAWLAATHTSFVDQFIKAPDFGVSRVRPLRWSAKKKFIELPEPPVISFPQPPEPPPAASADEGAPAAGEVAAHAAGPATPPPETALRESHESGMFDFVNPAGFGYVQNREQVFGFQSHGFREAPKPVAPEGNTTLWQIVRLELVSLLKHDPPAAYISENLPRMEDLREAPTRLLDEFEASALQKLRTEELVVEAQPQEIRMVGALRALKQCTECHSVERGELLGAFTYRLVPANARPRRDAAPARKNAL